MDSPWFLCHPPHFLLSYPHSQLTSLLTHRFLLQPLVDGCCNSDDHETCFFPLVSDPFSRVSMTSQPRTSAISLLSPGLQFPPARKPSPMGQSPDSSSSSVPVGTFVVFFQLCFFLVVCYFTLDRSRLWVSSLALFLTCVPSCLLLNIS